VLNQVNDHPVKALFVYSSNPAAVCPQHNEVVRGLMRPDLFTVVHEQFFTDTTDYADIVLPATTFLEHKDLQKAYGHYYLQVSEQAIEPLGECKSNVELFQLLAQRMGFTEECFGETVDQMIDSALESDDPWMRGMDRRALEEHRHLRFNFAAGELGELRSAGPSHAPVHTSSVPTFADKPYRPFLPFARGGFRTPSGKAELYSDALKAQGLDPVAAFLPPIESRHGANHKNLPLELLARKADNFLNTTFCNIPSVAQMEEMGLLEIASADAQSRGIADGDRVRVYNGRGEILLRARVDGGKNDGKVQPGVVSASLNWVKMTPGFQSINALTSEKLTDMGNSATFYSVLVEVELFKPSHEATAARPTGES
jgi:anaerobic selenocysteine-containing dehydrogenase